MGWSGDPSALAYGLAMTLGFCIAGYYTNRRLSSAGKLAFAALAWLIIAALVLSYDPTALAAALIGASILFVYLRKKFVAFMVVAAIIGGYFFVKDFQAGYLWKRIESSAQYSEQARRRELQQKFELFKAHPWLGAGSPLRVNGAVVAPAPNTYFQILATTGLLGFLGYMAFCLSFLFCSLRLWHEIPPTHIWHRVFLLGATGGQIVFHTAGLYRWTHNNVLLMGTFLFFIAVVAFLNERYSRGLVSDDFSI